MSLVIPAELWKGDGELVLSGTLAVSLHPCARTLFHTCGQVVVEEFHLHSIVTEF